MSDPTLVIHRRDLAAYPAERTVWIDRRSRWGNPYAIGPVPGRPELRPRTRPEVIRLYSLVFESWLKSPEFRAATLALRGKVLVCWCKPLACHGDVIKTWLDSQKEE